MIVRHFFGSIARTLSLGLAVFALSGGAGAQDQVLNLYSSRHYQTDETLYENFTRQTGIRINRVEGGEDALIERIRNEGDKSPADVLITVDAGRLWRAEQYGLFQPVKSASLETRIPAAFRNPDGLWFGFSSRARIIAYSKERVKPGEIVNYEDLADPRWKGRICTRSSGHVYNLSLIGSLVAHLGEQKAEAWVKAVAANLARPPQGGDTDQLKAVAAGQCDLAISNSYYYVRLMKSDKPEDKKVIAATGLIWPNQKSFGTHMNVSGAGVIKTAPNKAAAIKFLEYLTSDSAQTYFASGNNEWPVVKSAPLDNAALASLGNFKMDTLNISALGKNQPTAQKIFDRVGYK